MRKRSQLSEVHYQIIRKYGLEPEKLKNCIVCSYDFGDLVVKEDREIDYLFLIIEGRAKVGVAAPNGKNLIICFYISDGLIGEVEYYSNTNIGCTTVTALGKLDCVAIPAAENRSYLNNNLEFSRIAATALADKLARQTINVVENTLYSAKTRLCRYILDVSVNNYFRDIMMDVAYSVGVSYRHLYRMMSQLCDEGIIEKDVVGYHICKLDKLKEIGKHY